MAAQKPSEEQDPILTFSDFIHVVKKSYRKILYTALTFALIAAAYTLTRPVTYQFIASFKDKGNVNASNSPIGSLLGGGSSSTQSEAVTWMKSLKIQKRLIKRNNLQAVINYKNPPKTRYLTRINNNLRIDYASLLDRPYPNLLPYEFPLTVTDVKYGGELPLHFTINFIDSTQFKISKKTGEYIGQGTLGTLFAHDNYTFTLNLKESEQLPKDTLTLELKPLDPLAEKFSSTFVFQTDNKDKTLVNIFFKHPDKYLGAQIINDLMSLYKQHQQEEHLRITQEQVAYLQRRQAEAKQNLQKAMEVYAQEQSNDVKANGFPNAETALKFLASKQQEYQDRLIAIDLESKRLTKAFEEGLSFYESYIPKSDPAFINALMSEIRKYKQDADGIELSIHQFPASFEESKSHTLTKHMSELENVQAKIDETKAILAEINQDNLIVPSQRLMNDQRFLIKSWHEKLKEYLAEKELGKLSEKDWNSRKGQFVEYLTNLLQLFEVHSKALRDRLSHQGDIYDEFKGINLEIARELFFAHNKELNNIESQLLTYQFVLDNLQHKDFELNSLNNLLKDQISQNLINNYSTLLFTLQDESNRSFKEQDRIKNELLRVRKFLEMHISQCMQVQNLSADLFRGKIYALQKASLALMKQHLSLLDKQMRDYISTRTNNLHQERQIIKDHLEELKSTMSILPRQWLSQQLMNYQYEMSKDFGREISHLVESKNITGNLEVVQSSPVNLAFTPLYPKKTAHTPLLNSRRPSRYSDLPFVYIDT